jgi:MFS family permease
VLVVVAGAVPGYLAACVVMVPLGLAALTFTTAANSLVQMSVEPALRGRVMGLYILLFLGGTPVGAPLLGLLAEVYGGRAPLLLGGAVTLLSVLVVAAVLARRAGGARSLLRAEQRLG